MASLSSSTAERPKPNRQTTGDVLSYYFQDSSQEPEREPSPAPARRKSSSRSHRSPEMPSSTNDAAAAKLHRRRSSRTENAGDRRRIAIMEMDGPPLPMGDATAVDDGTSQDMPTSQLLARRGLDQTRLALVAPPDAAPISYSTLSPPPPVSAPAQPFDMSRKQQESTSSLHQRSKSNMEGARTHNPSRSFSSRDIGIVGTIRSAGRTPNGDEHSPKMLSLENPSSSRPLLAADLVSTPEEDAVAPIFQTPPSRTPSPDLITDTPHPGVRPSLPPWATSGGVIITPEIGQGKELGTRVAPPVVTMITNPSRLNAHKQAPASSAASHSNSAGPSSGSSYEPMRRSDSMKRAASQHVSPSGSNLSSPTSEYSSNSSRGGAPYYPVPAQQYQPSSFSGKSQPGYDSIVRDVPGPPLEPPRAAPLPSLTPPPRPPRLNTPHSKRAEAKAREDATQKTPTQTPVIAQTSLNSPESHSPNSQTPTAKKPAITSIPPHVATDALNPQSLFLRQMSDFSISAVTVSSSASDEDPLVMSTAPTSEAVVPSLRSTPSLRRLSSGPESSDSKHAREGAQGFPPSAFRRDLSPETGNSRSSGSSPDKLTQVGSDYIGPRKTSEEVRLEEMLVSMSPLLMAASKSPPRANPPSLPMLEDRHSDAESTSGVSTGVSLGSPVLPDPPGQTGPQRLESRSPSLQAPTPESAPSPVKLERQPDAQGEGSISSMDDSFVHASRPESPIPESIQAFHQQSARRPSLSLAVSSAKRLSAERSPSISSSIGRLAARAQFRAPAMHSSLSSPNIPTGRKARAITTMPDAMRFDDVLRCKTSLERAQGYARKINELARVDTGLTQWMLVVKHRGNTASGAKQLDKGLLVAGGQLRKVSSGSQASEFPTRPDATVATEITAGDSPPRGVPPSIPYPVLAQGIGVRSNSTRSYNSSTSLASSTSGRTLPGGQQNVKRPGGFFSTIGRKSSTRRDRTLPLPNSNPLSRQTSALTGQVPLPESPSRATRPPLVPSIPGGPRDPPNRSQRNLDPSRRSSVDTSMMPQPSTTTSVSDKRRSVGPGAHSPAYARPTEPLMRTSSRAPQTNGSSASFTAGLQRMADVLPHVDRSLLSVYLQDAGGEDILAITRYVEDEKRGTLKRHNV